MNRSLVAQFILRLQDRTSAGLGAIQRRLQGLAQVARRVALVGGALGALSVMGPIQQAAALESQMRATAITAGLTGAAVEEMMLSNMVMFQAVARETNQRVRDLALAAGTLVAGGGRAGEVWEQLVPIIGRVATASGANANDLAQSVLAMVNNLRLGPEQVEQALASMVQAGREGQFELRDMAREFAGLTAAAAGIGLTGPSAINSLSAALQVARQGAGTAGEAATNLTNILQKMTAPDAVRNFREMGVDLEGVMRDAATRGINPLEALIQKIRQVTGGDMFRVSDLFADSQVLAFLRPMIQDTERYIAVRDRAAAASPSLIAEGQEDAMRGLDAAIRRLSVGWDEFGVRIGVAAEGPVRLAGDALLWVSDKVRALEAAFPGLTAQLGFGIAALTAGAAAVTTLGLVIGPLGAGLLALKGGVTLLLAPFRMLVSLLLALGAPAGVAAGAVALLATSMVMAALHIWRNWERFSAFFRQMARGLVSIAAGVGEYFMGLFTLDAQRSVAGLRQIWGGLAGFFTGLWNTIKGVFTDFAAWVDGWTGGAATTALNALLKLIQDLQKAWDAFRTSFTTGELPSIAGVGPALGQVQERQRAARANPGAGFYPPEALAGATGGAPPPRLDGRVTVEVRPAPGAEIASTESDNINVTVTAPAPNRGATRGRP